MSILLLVTMLITVIAACSKSNGGDNATSTDSGTVSSAAPTTEANKALDPVSLKVLLFGEKPAEMDKVIAEFEKRTKNTLNTKLDFTFDLPDQYPNKLKLKLTAGEAFDLAFDAPWWNMNQNISKGYYQELDKYFNNDEYPGLKKAFTAEFLENNKVNGHIYGIPVTNYFSDTDIIVIRKDLREKYGLQPIKSYDELKVYLDKVKENNPEMLPMGLGRNTFYRLFNNFKDKQTNYRAFPYDIGETAAWFNIVLSEDGKKVLGATTIGDPDADYAKLPAPFNNQDFFNSYLDKRVEFSKYLPKDVFNAGNSAGGQKPASYEKSISGYAQNIEELKRSDPGASLEFFVYNDAVRNMEPGAIGTNYKAWNFLTIPMTSKNTDRTMKYLDWLFSDPDNHDLFELGIEGEHWTKDGDGKYKLAANNKNYVFPGYEMTWNPLMSRMNSANDPEALKYIEYQAKNDSYYALALKGFTFNSDSVKAEIAKVQPKFDDFNKFIQAGQEPKWREKAAKVNTELRALGLETIRAELLKQIQAYLDAGGK